MRNISWQDGLYVGKVQEGTQRAQKFLDFESVLSLALFRKIAQLFLMEKSLLVPLTFL